MKLIEHKNMLIRTKVKAEMKESVYEIGSQDVLSNIDKKIIRGLYEKRFKKDKAEQAAKTLRLLFKNMRRYKAEGDEGPDNERQTNEFAHKFGVIAVQEE